MSLINNFANKYIETFKETSNRLTHNKLYLIGGVIWFFITLVLVYYTYNLYIKPLLSKHKLNKEFTNQSLNNDNDKVINIKYFYTEWCPYCKKALPEWKKFESYINSQKSNLDYTINLEKINCDELKNIADKYKITGYPTVKLIYKGKIYDFDAKVTKENLIEFFNSIISK